MRVNDGGEADHRKTKIDDAGWMRDKENFKK